MPNSRREDKDKESECLHMSATCCEHCSVSSQDHDLLIQLGSKIDHLATAVSAAASKSDFVNDKETGRKVHEDHEKRLRSLERYAWMAIGVLAVFNIMAISGLLYHIMIGGRP